MKHIQLSQLSTYLSAQTAVQQYLGTNNCNISEAVKFNVGQSNPTYLIKISNNPKSLVLRTKPEGHLLPGAHQIEREYEITSKLSTVKFPVAKPLCFCSDINIIGTPFYIMEYVEGRIFKDLKMTTMSKQEKQDILFEHARVLAQLHSIDYKQLGLEQFGKPEQYYKRQISTWSRQYKLASTNNNKSMEDLMYWLPQNIPVFDSNDNVCICHGDFAINNVIFHPTLPIILAVIDWELATIGQAYADVAYMTLSYFLQPINSNAHPGGIKEIWKYLNIPKYEDVINVYTNHRNISIQPDLRFHTAFSMFRLSSIAQGVYKRALQGNASQAKQGLEMYKIGETLSNDAWELVQSLSNGDPFKINELIKDDSKWGQWVVSDRCKSYYYRVKQFVLRHIIPNEKELLNEALNRSVEQRWQPLKKLHELKEQAKNEGLWNLFCTDVVYGKGLSNLEYAFICELMGMSMFAPEIFNCSAPDTGNMEVLMLYANQQQKQKYLQPLLDGKIRSCFAMTEPDVGSSDATNITTSIQANSQGYLVNGKKWYISGAGDERCKVAIVMGKTSQDQSKPHLQQSMILIDLPHPNVQITRAMQVFGFDDAPHGHMEMVFNNVQVPKENIIWKEGAGFEIAQGRLGGGRLHHCMRLIGISQRAIHLMIQRGQSRLLFKQKLGDNHAFQQKLGELETLLTSCRLMVFNAAMQLDLLGNKKSDVLKALSECKVYVPKIAQQIIDEVIQVFGAEGVSQDQILTQAFIQARTLRIADGPDAVHYRQVARYAFRNHLKSDMPKSIGYGLSKL